MKRQFTVTLDMGNAAMLTCDDVARALEDVIAKLRDERSNGIVRDGNGNTVGRFAFTSEEGGQL